MQRFLVQAFPKHLALNSQLIIIYYYCAKLNDISPASQAFEKKRAKKVAISLELKNDQKLYRSILAFIPSAHGRCGPIISPMFFFDPPSSVMAIIARLLLINYAMGKLLKLDGNCLCFKWHYGFQALQNICSLLFKCQQTNDRAGIFNICVDLTMGPTAVCCTSNDISLKSLLILCRLLYSKY